MELRRDAAINLIGTADVHSQGESEEIVDRALAGSARASNASPASRNADDRGRQRLTS
jgi:aryl-alcohol dehydrogenase-like predicted oxidoreductase